MHGRKLPGPPSLGGDLKTSKTSGHSRIPQRLSRLRGIKGQKIARGEIIGCDLSQNLLGIPHYLEHLMRMNQFCICEHSISGARAITRHKD